MRCHYYIANKARRLLLFINSDEHLMISATFKNNKIQIRNRMPKFLDVHSLKDLDQETRWVR